MENALVIDADVFSRQIVSSVLMRFGYPTRSVATCAEALENFPNLSELKIIVVDCDEKANQQICRKIRQKELFHHPLLVGTMRQAVSGNSLPAELDDHLFKPLQGSTLEELLLRWGCISISDRRQLMKVQSNLRRHRAELEEEFDRLRKQNFELKEQYESVLDSNSYLRRRLEQWRQNLEAREWALKTRERFLTKRQEKTALSLCKESRGL